MQVATHDVSISCPCPRSNFHCQLIDAVGQAVIATDLDGTISYWNSAAESLYGWTSAEVLGKKIQEVTPADRQESEEVGVYIKAGMRWEGELQKLRRDGSTFPAHVTVTPLFDDSGVLAGAVGVSTDITAQKNAMKALELERGRLLSVFEHAPARICVLRGPDHVIQMVNPAYRELLGDCDLIGKPTRVAFPEFKEQGFLDMLDEVYRTGDPVIGHHIPVRFDSAVKPEMAKRFVNFVYQPLKEVDGSTSGILVHSVDVTDEVEALLAVEKSARSNQLLMDNSLDIICSFDYEGRFVAVSAACERVWGYSPAEIIGRNYRELVLTDDAERTEDSDRRVRQDAILRQLETRFVHKNGSIVDMLWSASWSDADQLVFAVGKNVTEKNERTLALAAGQAALRKSELRLRSFVDASAQLVWSANESGATLEVGESWASLTNPADEHMVEQNWIQLIHPEDQSSVIQAWDDHRATKSTFELEYRLRTSNGSYRWVTARAVPVFDEDGAFIEWIGTCSDINGRKEAEAALRESESRYRTIVDTAREGVWLIDRTASTTFVNARLAEILGYGPEEILGRSLFEFIAADDRVDMQSRFERRKTGVSENYDIRFRRRDGTTIWTHISASPFYDERGDFFGSVGMVTDITDRKWYEQELIDAKEKAEEMVRLKSAFLANMSHEIRTPLTGIIGFSEVLVEEASDDVKSMAALILSSGERLLLTLNSVMDLAQLESRSVRLEMESLEVVQQVRDVLPIFDRNARERGLYLCLQFDQPRIRARADQGALSRVLVNIIDNALKFTDSGGVIVRVSGGDERTSIAVSDTGIGISESFFPKIFDDFVQESEGLARAYEGVGLGLSITKRLVDLMDGTIDVSSEKGKGTTFTVHLPASAQELVPIREPGPRRVKSGSPRILAVEDQNDAYLLLERLLFDGYELTRATTAAEAFDLADRRQFHLVIMDINLGHGPDGRHVMRELRRRASYADVPIIACTAYAMPGDEEQFLADGFNAYIGKPYRKRSLLDALTSLLPKIRT